MGLTPKEKTRIAQKEVQQSTVYGVKERDASRQHAATPVRGGVTKAKFKPQNNKGKGNYIQVRMLSVVFSFEHRFVITASILGVRPHFRNEESRSARIISSEEAAAVQQLQPTLSRRQSAFKLSKCTCTLEL